MAQQRAVLQNAAESQRHTAAARDVQSTKPVAAQRDVTDLASLARSKPLASRRTVSNIGSLARGGRGR